jgi:hypothetical protein
MFECCELRLRTSLIAFELFSAIAMPRNLGGFSAFERQQLAQQAWFSRFVLPRLFNGRWSGGKALPLACGNLRRESSRARPVQRKGGACKVYGSV